MPIDPVLGSFMADAAVAGVNAVTKGGPRRQYKWNKRAAQDQQVMNRSNAEWALEQNKRLQEEQRMYDAPAAQMQRYKEAGLNPHLIYGSGSSAGGAFPIEAGNIAPARLDAPQAGIDLQIPSFIGAQMAGSQIMLRNQQVQESMSRTALIDMQKDIAKTNPMLDPTVYRSITDSMQKVAELKAAEASYMKHGWFDRDDKTSERNYVAKIHAEIEALSQRLGLNTADLAIRNKILESKDFENEVKRIQTEWLKDGDFTPEHIRQGLMLLLSKMLGR